ncbi:HSP20-like chaperone [Rhizophagus diaphanus]|nr:HSP20-like chaperone [Rhizophagus diaphanus] [Rhizophagus sp. MUCL 43196]
MSLISNNWDNFDLDSVSRIFDDFIKDLNVAKRDNTRSRRFPALEVHETEKEYIVNAELPGLSKDQINADVHNNVLVISGEVKKDQKFQEGKTLVQERHYGNFSRSISLPPNIKTEEVTAKFENGVLEMKLPKSAPSGKKIDIK